MWRTLTTSCATVLAAGCLLCTSVTQARQGARGQTSSLSWLRLPDSERCMGSLSLARAVERRLGRPVFVAPSRATLAVEGRVEPRTAALDSGYKATISVTRLDGSIVGTRVLETLDATCRELDEGVALVIALLIDPNARADVESKRAERPAPAAPRRTGFCPALAAGIFVALAQLPDPALGISVSGALRHHGKSLELGLGATLPVDARDADAEGSFRLVFGALSLCGTMLRAAFAHADLCTGIELARISATRLSFEADPLRVEFVNALARARFALHVVGPLWSELELWGTLPLARPHFTYSVLDADALRLEDRELFRVPPFGGRAMASLSAHF
ncbi:MAG TPA: hypothetical protein VI072_18160 [Polyangiaceae bacterium]